MPTKPWPPKPPGALPLLESVKDDTDPDVFGRPDPNADTVPRCMTCGRRSDDDTAFDQGVAYALRGVHWMLLQGKGPAHGLSRSQADNFVLWLRSGISR